MDRIRPLGPGYGPGTRLNAYGEPIMEDALAGPGVAFGGGNPMPGPGGPLGLDDLVYRGGPTTLGDLVYRGEGVQFTPLSGALTSYDAPQALGGSGGLPTLTTRAQRAKAAAAKVAGSTGQSGEGGSQNAAYDSAALPTTGLPGVKATVMRWQPQVTKWANQFGVPVEAILALMDGESSGDPNAQSAHNPGYGTAKGLLQTLSLHYSAGENPFDPDTNLRVGIKLFSDTYHKYGNRLDSAMAAYFGGPGVLDANGNVKNPNAADANGMSIGRYVPRFLTKVAAYRNALGQTASQAAPQPAQVAGRPGVFGFTRNAAYPVTGEFGAKDGPYPGQGHVGMDIGVPRGTQLSSPIAATVVHAGGDYNRGGYGHAVVLRTDDGYTIILGHLDSVDAVAGQRVPIGARLGLSGSTGKSTGPHLHLEVRDQQGRPINPRTYFTGG